MMLDQNEDMTLKPQPEAAPAEAPVTPDAGLLFNPIQVTPKPGLTPEMALEELATTHVSQLKKRADWRKPFEDMWTTIYKLRMGKMDSVRLKTRAKAVMPKVFQALEAGVPKLVSIIFGKTPWFQVTDKWPTRPLPADVKANIEALLGHQLDLAGFFKLFVEFCKGLLAYGTGYIVPTWKVKREWVTERVADRAQRTLFGIPLPGYDLTWRTQKTLKVVERRPDLRVLPIEAVYPASDQTDVQEGNGIYWVDNISMADLEELSKGRAPIYANFEKVKEGTNGSAATAPMSDLVQQKASARGVNDPSSISYRDKDSVELINFWGKADLDQDGFREEVHIVIANRSVVVRACPNPYEHQKRPLIKGSMFPVENEWFGMGIVEPAIPAIAEINTLHNQNLDQNNLIINRMWKVDPTMDVDLDTLVSIPNGIVLSTPLEAVKELEQGSIPFSPIQMIQLLDAEIEATMVPKSVQGTPESGALGRTARGAQLIVNQALEKFGMAARLIEETVLHPLLMMMHQMNGQFLDQDEYLQDIYQNIFPTKPTPEQIRSDINFQFLGVNETVTKEATINQITAFVNTWGALLQQMGVPLLPLARQHWGLMDTRMSAQEALPEPAPQPMLPKPAGAPAENPAGNAVAAQVAQNGTSGGLELPPLQPLEPLQ